MVVVAATTGQATKAPTRARPGGAAPCGSWARAASTISTPRRPTTRRRYMLGRAWTRQLVTYPADRDPERAAEIVADVATDVPSTANGGISADGTTYTFTLRDGVRWDTDPPRDVTAQDFVRGLERLCNPKTPIGAPGYFTTTIDGFDAYCEGLTKVAATPTAISDYLEAEAISGDHDAGRPTLEITLRRPDERLPQHHGVAVRLGGAAGVPAVPAGQPGVPPEHDLQRPVLDRHVRGGPAHRAGPQPRLG